MRNREVEGKRIQTSTTYLANFEAKRRSFAFDAALSRLKGCSSRIGLCSTVPCILAMRSTSTN